jgi:hypothetical protein
MSDEEKTPSEPTGEQTEPESEPGPTQASPFSIPRVDRILYERTPDFGETSKGKGRKRKDRRSD